MPRMSAGDVDFLHVSSGSTGEPTFWARAAISEIGIAGRLMDGRTTVAAFWVGA